MGLDVPPSMSEDLERSGHEAVMEVAEEIECFPGGRGALYNLLRCMLRR